MLFSASFFALIARLNTGDLARIDARGYVWLTGRQKELIIRGGHNIEPAMIEDAMTRHPAVQFAAAVGKPDAYAGELPVVTAWHDRPHSRPHRPGPGGQIGC